MSVLSIPKYTRAKQKMLSYIGKEGLDVGDKLPPEKELSEMFDVSMITLRRALLELSEEGVIERLQGRGTFVQSRISNGEKLGAIGFLAVDQWSYPSPTQLEVLRKLLYKRGYKMRYFVAKKTPDSAILEELANLRGVFISGWVNDEWLKCLDNYGVPVVVIGEYALTRETNSVHYDWKQAGKVMAEHFAGQGLRKLGLVCSEPSFYPGQQIHKGFMETCQTHALDVRDSDVVWPIVGQEETMIMNFLSANQEKYDALVVQEGNYSHLLACLWECDYMPKLKIGVVGEEERISSRLSRIVGTEFSTSVTEEAVELFFSLLDQKVPRYREIRIKPVIRQHSATIQLSSEAPALS
ncbi:GntR family transcriptional regulator [Coraliomargarita parva]|uniref:GntR family transcriptional regulator n=1 Tax=Coraliomargarita parva TaxID=3014050 RepID=UPI0022B47913|nr:GntR family transcriptional regulator [Coraliomargarita parva]